MRDYDFTVITVALERNFDDPRPYVSDVDPDHPSLVDRRHIMADLYDIENVPTALWIDEERRIVRPNDVVFGSETFKLLANVDSQEHIDALKDWVRNDTETSPLTMQADERREHDSVPDDNRRLGRAYYQMAQWLYENGYQDRAVENFERACTIAPEDVAIRRGSMRMRGENPMGWGFVKMFTERLWNGLGYYNPIG